MIDNFRVGALKSCEGNRREADYFLDCSVAEYYTRLKDRMQYVEWHNKQLKDQMK